MADAPTIGDLVKTKVITSEEVEAATQALLDNPAFGTFQISADYRPDLAAALAAHKPSATALADPDRTKKFKLTMARTAILLARPVKA